MTKRRWLKSAIEESKKPQVALPWSRATARIDTAPLAVSEARRGKEIRA